MRSFSANVWFHPEEARRRTFNNARTRDLGAMEYKFQFITLAGFHALNYFRVDTQRPYERVRFLKALMPRKPLAELYTAIGYHKHGKTEFYRDFLRHLEASEDQFEKAEGAPGYRKPVAHPLSIMDVGQSRVLKHVSLDVTLICFNHRDTLVVEPAAQTVRSTNIATNGIP